MLPTAYRVSLDRPLGGAGFKLWLFRRFVCLGVCTRQERSLSFCTHFVLLVRFLFLEVPWLCGRESMLPSVSFA